MQTVKGISARLSLEFTITIIKSPIVLRTRTTGVFARRNPIINFGGPILHTMLVVFSQWNLVV